MEWEPILGSVEHVTGSVVYPIKSGAIPESLKPIPWSAEPVAGSVVNLKKSGAYPRESEAYPSVCTPCPRGKKNRCLVYPTQCLVYPSQSGAYPMEPGAFTRECEPNPESLGHKAYSTLNRVPTHHKAQLQT